MRFGSLLLIAWLIIGAIAAGQRGDFKRPLNCSNVGTAAVTVAAGLLNYTHVNPHVNCTTPRPSD